MLLRITRKARFVNRLLSESGYSPLFLVYGVWLFSAVDVADAEIGLAVEFAGMLFNRTPWPASEYFGAFLANATASPEPSLLIAGASLAGFDTNQLDFDGKFSVLGCAANNEAILLSGPGFSGRFLADIPIDVTGQAIHWVPDTTLPALTSVDGEQSRFHPIWLLGKPITPGVAP